MSQKTSVRYLSSTVGAISADQLRKVVEWAGACPSLTKACRQWLDAPGGQGVADLPQMTEAQALEAARWHLRGHPAHYTLSSGTTGPPRLKALIAKDTITVAHLGEWQPLCPGDVMLNLFPRGTAHRNFERIAELYCAHTAPGVTERDALIGLGPSLGELGVNVLAGYPETLALFADIILERGVPLRPRTVVWTGGHMTAGCMAVLRELNPDLEFWGIYSSSEAGAVAFSFPGCAPGVSHLCHGQLLELTAGGCYLTRATGLLAGRPLLRTRLNDTLAAVECSCARDLPAVRVLGRAGAPVVLHGASLQTDSLRLAAADTPEVMGAQVLLVPADPGDASGSLRRLGVRVQPRRTAGAQGVAVRTRARVLQRNSGLRAVTERHPEAFWVEIAPLERFQASGKTQPVVMVAEAR
ncbi:hypothetical protein ACWGII_18545 [Streptomyces sp. NPDC054855]